MRAAAEMGIRTVAIYSTEDRFALHRFKADESYLVGAGKKPIQAYLDIDDIMRIAQASRSRRHASRLWFSFGESRFRRSLREKRHRLYRPQPEVMRLLGNKVAARELAETGRHCRRAAATGALPNDLEQAKRLPTKIGYPLMLKASWGGGGRGMRVVESAKGAAANCSTSARREAKAAFGNDEVYLEKLVRRARHVEVQILGDTHGNLVHLFERDCSVQRRNQKVVERAPAPYLERQRAAKLCVSRRSSSRAPRTTLTPARSSF